MPRGRPLGFKVSDETRARMSDATVASWQDPRRAKLMRPRVHLAGLTDAQRVLYHDVIRKLPRNEALALALGVTMPARVCPPSPRHCEEQSDEAIPAVSTHVRCESLHPGARRW